MKSENSKYDPRTGLTTTEIVALHDLPGFYALFPANQQAAGEYILSTVTPPMVKRLRGLVKAWAGGDWIATQLQDRLDSGEYHSTDIAPELCSTPEMAGMDNSEAIAFVKSRMDDIIKMLASHSVVALVGVAGSREEAESLSKNLEVIEFNAETTIVTKEKARTVSILIKWDKQPLNAVNLVRSLYGPVEKEGEMEKLQAWLNFKGWTPEEVQNRIGILQTMLKDEMRASRERRKQASESPVAPFMAQLFETLGIPNPLDDPGDDMTKVLSAAFGSLMNDIDAYRHAQVCETCKADLDKAMNSGNSSFEFSHATEPSVQTVATMGSVDENDPVSSPR